MLKKLKAAVILVFVLSLILPALAFAQRGEAESVDVIIQTTGSTEALASHIQSRGGVVHFQYENVDALAATIPASELASVGGFPGVLVVEKDKLISLPDSEVSEGRTMSHALDAAYGAQAVPLDTATLDPSSVPSGYANYALTGAADIWDETSFGEGSVVAVVDTGTVPNVCLSHAVTGAPGFPDGYNATSDGFPATYAGNHWHGTHVGGVIASACSLSLTEDDPLWLAIDAILPGVYQFDDVPLLGQAPGALLYPVKVFDTSGSSTPTSVILDGLDHLLTLKLDGLLDIDIVNMSLGGPTVFDGHDTFDAFMAELWKANILVVTSAGNAGPPPNSVGSPGTSLNSISVAALDYAVSSRILYEYLGLAFFGAPGGSLISRPDDHTFVVNFSSRGPLSDGRGGPDISALGTWNFHAWPDNSLHWASGTSFASPTVAGVAALLNAYWENVKFKETNPNALTGALYAGADREAVPSQWRRFNDMGRGAVDAVESLNRIQSGTINYRPMIRTGVLTPNILPPPAPETSHSYQSPTIDLNPAEKFDLVLKINEFTSRVTIEVTDIVVADNFSYSFFGDALEMQVQSAKRSDDAVFAGLLQAGIETLTFVVEDGPWTADVNGGGPFEVAYAPMEPGLMKISFAGDFVNEQPVSFRVRVTRETFRTPLSDPISSGPIEMDDAILVPFDVPAGATQVTFDLDWGNKWDSFPTSDLDMLVYDPAMTLISEDGATGHAPERAVISAPAEGTWWVLVQGFELYTPDAYDLYATLE